MWTYEKRLQFPVKITKTCPKTAQLIISQYGGPDGELSASMRYLSQRYTMPVKAVGGLLTDIGTEELAHMEMICAMVYQLTRHLTVEEAKTAGFDAYYIDHTAALWPQAAAGVPYTALEFQSKGDALADLTEDLAAEQKASLLAVQCYNDGTALPAAPEGNQQKRQHCWNEKSEPFHVHNPPFCEEHSNIRKVN